MKTFGWLLKREYWEHRGGFFWTPVWISGVMLLLTVLGIIVAEAARSRVTVNGGIPWERISEKLSAGDFVQAGAGLDIAYVAVAVVLCIALFFVLFFYLLGALYDDRRDRSVLFWKSLPVSDTATVLSKVAAAVFLAPLLSFVIATIAYFVLLVVVCLWGAVHGINAFPAIGAAHTLGIFGRALLTLPVDAIYALPTVGWLLFWSAYARSKPFLWAVLVPVFALIANSWIGLMGLPNISREFLMNEVLGRLLFGIMPGAWLRADRIGFGSDQELFGENIVARFDPGVVYASLANPGVWIAAAVGIALIAVAIQLRRSRIETAT
jgi:ABC-2 type transport system permease protein